MHRRLDEVKSEEENTAAKLAGHKSANSGAWLSKLADMRLYGLMEARSIKLTPIAEKLTYGTEEEKQDSINKIVLNVPLWKELYSRFGVKLPESNFWVQIQRITGVDALEAQKSTEFIRKAYLDDISHIKATKEADLGKGGKMGDAIDMTVSTINIQAGQFSQTIPLTKEGIELAKGFLDLLGKQIGTKKKEEAEGKT